MRWEVQGAEAATGRDITISVEAITAEEAEQQARYNGVLVSRVSKAGGPPAPALQYAGDYSKEALTHSGYGLRNDLTLREYAQVIREVLRPAQSRPTGAGGAGEK